MNKHELCVQHEQVSRTSCRTKTQVAERSIQYPYKSLKNMVSNAIFCLGIHHMQQSIENYVRVISIKL